jgi:RND family efflux transporter MFP subunit
MDADKTTKPDLSQLKITRREPPAREASWLKPWMWLIPAVPLLLWGGRWWLSSGERPAVNVQVAQTAGAAAVSSVLDASGYVTARRHATVSSKRTGKVKSVLVEEGMRVAAGQVVAYLDDATEQAQLALAAAQRDSARAALAETQAELKEAELNLKRTEELAERRLASAADLDAARAKAEALEARLAAGRENAKVAERRLSLEQQQLDETIIRAPFGGIVVAKTAQPGEMISPVSAGGGFTRTGICTIVDMESFVQSEQPVTAVLDAYPDWRIRAEVIAIVPTADRQKATVKVRVGFLERDARVLPDMGVKVAFMEDDSQATTRADEPGVLVPRAAIRTDAGRPYVFVLKDDVARRRDIELGSVQGQTVQVLQGLAPGEQVIVAPPEGLAAGARVQVL